MCGIVGVGCFQVGGMWADQSDMFKQLLIVDSLRGIDGTGIVRVLKSGEVDWRKMEGNPFDLFRNGSVYNWLSQTVSGCDKVLIGHNRLATVGSVSTNNAHPFEVDHITLVHNGYIANLEEISKEADKKEVDSHGLALALAKNDPLEVLRTIRGAYSIVFYDSQKRTLNFARNAERPMFYMFDEAGKKLAFASERWALAGIADRVKYVGGAIVELPTHSWLQFDVMTGDKPRITPYNPKPFNAKRAHTPTWAGFGSCLNDCGTDEFFGANDPWEREPDARIWKKKTPIIEHPPVNQQAANARPLLPFKNNKKNTKDVHIPEQLFGYRVGHDIQFAGVQKFKNSSVQDQWRLVCAHPTHAELDIWCFVKGETTANAMMEAHLCKGTIRALQILDGKPVVIVTNPDILMPIVPEETTQKASLLH